ncbi:hypothetical protein Mal52_28480 [Symmachiella dynata]|uniref:Uncharacterized protein n=1 Tax=Symmachiella dynata TaxID=2527995 RepID=A0A517ZPF9_9PLAN|nr:hypothetical protein Mal52_28480 [Symmachiella dynata]
MLAETENYAPTIITSATRLAMSVAAAVAWCLQWFYDIRYLPPSISIGLPSCPLLIAANFCKRPSVR